MTNISAARALPTAPLDGRQKLDLSRRLEAAFYSRGWPKLRYAAEFDESQHPRDAVGQWAKKGEGAAKRKALEAHHWRMVDQALAGIHADVPHVAEVYRQSMKQVFAGLSDDALGKLKDHVTAYHFYRTPAEVQEAYHRLTGIRRHDLDGFFGHKTGEVHLNGGFESGQSPWAEPAAVVYAHEIGHALDREQKITDDDRWRDIWADELHGAAGELASMSPAEGFASFAEIVLLDRREAERLYPQATQFWKDKGLID